jgi:hypothetical protein
MPVPSDQLDAPSDPVTHDQQSYGSSSGGGGGIGSGTDMFDDADSVTSEDWLQPVPSDQLDAPISSTAELVAQKQQQQQQHPPAAPRGGGNGEQAASPSEPDTLSVDDWLMPVVSDQSNADISRPSVSRLVQQQQRPRLLDRPHAG